MKRLSIAAIPVLILGTTATVTQGTQSKTFMGAISSVDTEAKVLTVRDTTAGALQEAKTMTFKIDAQTKIEEAKPAAMGKSGPEAPTEGKSSLELRDLKVGQHVNVTYVESGGDYLARTVAVQTKSTT